MTPPYTHTKLNDVKDAAPDFGYGEVQEFLAAAGALHAEDTGVSLNRVRPGKRQELERLDAVRAAPGVTRQFEGGSEGLELLAFGPHHKGDGELIHDWWTD